VQYSEDILYNLRPPSPLDLGSSDSEGSYSSQDQLEIWKGLIDDEDDDIGKPAQSTEQSGEQSAQPKHSGQPSSSSSGGQPSEQPVLWVQRSVRKDGRTRVSRVKPGSWIERQKGKSKGSKIVFALATLQLLLLLEPYEGPCREPYSAL
jgi:hypothetical protein